MTEGKIKAPYPSPLPQSVLSFPPQPHQTLTHLWALTAPVPQPPCPFQKKMPKDPTSPPRSHLWVLPLSTPAHLRAQTRGHPGSPLLGGRAEQGRDGGWQRVLAAVPRACPHLSGASQLHSPPCQRRVIRLSFLKGSHPSGRFSILTTRFSYSLRAEPGARGFDGLSYPLTALLDEFCEEKLEHQRLLAGGTITSAQRHVCSSLTLLFSPQPPSSPFHPHTKITRKL